MPKKRQPKKTPPAAKKPLSLLCPAAKEAALDLAKGDRSRIEVVSETEAIVR